MYKREMVGEFVEYVQEELKSVKGDLEKLKKQVQQKFSLSDDRHTYYNENMAIRFSDINSGKSNCVVSLKKIIKYNDRPFFVVKCSDTSVEVMLINLTFISKVSHSSKGLRESNIVGTILLNDIIKKCEINGKEYSNAPLNFELLFRYHMKVDKNDNIKRIAENTEKICAKVTAFEPDKRQKEYIRSSVQRSIDFMATSEFVELKKELDQRVERVKASIIKAGLIPHVKERGNIIEYLITSDEDDETKKRLVEALNTNSQLPKVKTENALGDYHKKTKDYIVEIDIKSHIKNAKGSAPKGYNADKVLEFLAQRKTVFLLYFVMIDYETHEVETKVVSMYQKQLMPKQLIGHHSGRVRRGEVQFQKKWLEEVMEADKLKIDKKEAEQFLKNILMVDI